MISLHVFRLDDELFNKEIHSLKFLFFYEKVWLVKATTLAKMVS